MEIKLNIELTPEEVDEIVNGLMLKSTNIKKLAEKIFAEARAQYTNKIEEMKKNQEDEQVEMLDDSESEE